MENARGICMVTGQIFRYNVLLELFFVNGSEFSDWEVNIGRNALPCYCEWSRCCLYFG